MIMAIAPTATDMPQNELYENNNLRNPEVESSGRLTTGEYQICCAIIVELADDPKDGCRVNRRVPQTRPTHVSVGACFVASPGSIL
jgi:hypothetical protein